MNKCDGLSAEEARGRMIRRMLRCDESSACESENEETARARMIIRMLRTDADGDDKHKGSSDHGNTHIPYGLCKKFGIELPDGATPEEAWEALEGEGISVDKTYNTLQKKGTIRHIKPKNVVHESKVPSANIPKTINDGGLPEKYRNIKIPVKKIGMSNYTATEEKIKNGVEDISPGKPEDVSAYLNKQLNKLPSYYVVNMSGFNYVKNENGSWDVSVDKDWLSAVEKFLTPDEIAESCGDEKEISTQDLSEQIGMKFLFSDDEIRIKIRRITSEETFTVKNAGGAGKTPESPQKPKEPASPESPETLGNPNGGETEMNPGGAGVSVGGYNRKHYHGGVKNTHNLTMSGCESKLAKMKVKYVDITGTDENVANKICDVAQMMKDEFGVVPYEFYAFSLTPSDCANTLALCSPYIFNPDVNDTKTPWGYMKTQGRCSIAVLPRLRFWNPKASDDCRIKLATEREKTAKESIKKQEEEVKAKEAEWHNLTISGADFETRWAAETELYHAKNKLMELKDNLKYAKDSPKYEKHNVYEPGHELESLIVHEYGHVFAYRYSSTAGKGFATKEMREAYKKAKKTGDIYKISQYAESKPSEFFAECFTKYIFGQEMPDYCNEMVETVIEGVMAKTRKEK